MTVRRELNGMIETTKLNCIVDSEAFLKKAITAVTSTDVESLLAVLPIVPDDRYVFAPAQPSSSWVEGKFHWMPVGKDRGNAGRIKLAHNPINPIAERLINGMEALIELMQQREMLNDPSKEPPKSPREAIERYFGLPPLDQLPKFEGQQRKGLMGTARELARKLRIHLLIDKSSGEFTVCIDDDGIGQLPEKVHKTLLSLGSTNKGDKPYLIGVFGQGGSSAYSACKYSWVISRRAPDLIGDCEDGIGWTVIKHVFPKGRRDDYFAYLAAHPDGRVPFFDKRASDKVAIAHGTRFVHVNYNFGRGGAQVVRRLFPSLNHVLFNPVIPYELYAGRDSADLMSGNAYRLSNLFLRGPAPVLDKTFNAQSIYG